MATTYQLGDIIKRGTERWLVVRIVRSTALFESERGDLTEKVEHYLEIRNARGAVDFISLSMEETPFGGQPSGIKALAPIQYTRSDFDEQKTNAPGGESIG